jgi:hypothetical protein
MINSVSVNGKEIEIMAYQILNRNDCIITAQRDKAVAIEEELRSTPISTLQFCEDGTAVNTAELLIRDVRIESDDTGSRGYITSFVISYAEIPEE